MKKVALLFALFAMLFVTACSGPQTSVKELRSIVDEIEKNYDSYTDEELGNVITQLEAIEKEMEQYEYTDEELREIGRLNGRATLLLTKAYIKHAGSELGEITQEFVGGMEGFFDALCDEDDVDSTDEELEEAGRRKGKDLGKRLRNMAIKFGSGVEGFAEEFGKEIEALSDELEEELENIIDGTE